MFSNGTEYEWFLESNCFKCRKYKEDAELDSKIGCSIEKKLVLCRFLDRDEAEKVFPYKYLEQIGSISCYKCKKFQDKNIPYVPKHPRGHRQAKGQTSLL